MPREWKQIKEIDGQLFFMVCSYCGKRLYRRVRVDRDFLQIFCREDCQHLYHRRYGNRSLEEWV